jgi:hypothetical protein
MFFHVCNEILNRSKLRKFLEIDDMLALKQVLERFIIDIMNPNILN